MLGPHSKGRRGLHFFFTSLAERNGKSGGLRVSFFIDTVLAQLLTSILHMLASPLLPPHVCPSISVPTPHLLHLFKLSSTLPGQGVSLAHSGPTWFPKLACYLFLAG